MRIRKGSANDRKTSIDCNFKINTILFNRIINHLDVEYPTTTDEFYYLYTDNRSKLLENDYISRKMEMIDTWVRSYKLKNECDRLKEIEGKKEKSDKMTELSIHISKEDEYFQTALNGILSNPTTPFSMIDPMIIVEKADSIAKACMERSSK
jgi:hypothetical protein